VLERMARWVGRRVRAVGVGRSVKLAGVAVALVVMFIPLFFWPAGEDAEASSGDTSVVITVPPVAVVTSVLGEVNTTTTSLDTSGDPDIAVEEPVDITIAAIGDVSMYDSILSSTWDPDTGAYDFGSVFAPVAEHLSAADYTVCSLDTRLTGPNGQYGGYPRPSAPYSLATSLAAAGVDLVATATKHSADYGWEGLVGTLDRLRRADLAHVGTYRSPEDKETPLIVEIQGIKIAFIAYTETVSDPEGLSEDEAYALNTLDVDRAAEEAVTARLLGADLVIAILNYGEEYRRTPTDSQRTVSEGSARAEGLLSRGVDVVLGAGSHSVQPIVKVLQYSSGRRNDTFVAYSLGNFLSAERWRRADSGVIAYVHIRKQGLRTSVTGISYLPIYMQKSTGPSVEYRLLPVLPGLAPNTDIPPTLAEEVRMSQVWEELSYLLYRPDEGIVPLDPALLGLDGRATDDDQATDGGQTADDSQTTETTQAADND